MSVTSRLFLRVVSGSRQGTSVPLREDQVLVIGRVRGALRLDDPLISGAHCRIVFRAPHFVLQDLGSTNGTNVDGKPVQDILLRPGAEIVVGNTRIVVFDADDGAVSADDDGVAWLLDDEASVTTASAVKLSSALLQVPGDAPRLRVLAGVDRHQEFHVDQPYAIIGRNHGEVPLSDAEVSRKHAAIEMFGHSMTFMRDLGSTNGSYHNGRRVQAARLSPGDTIGCGKSVLRFLS